MKNKKLTKSASHTSKSAFRHQNIKSEKIKLEYIRESYLEKSLKQLFLGNFTEDVTLLGTGLQITAGIFNLDLLMDIRDLTADFCNWEWSWGHLAQSAGLPRAYAVLYNYCKKKNFIEEWCAKYISLVGSQCLVADD